MFKNILKIIFFLKKIIFYINISKLSKKYKIIILNKINFKFKKIYYFNRVPNTPSAATEYQPDYITRAMTFWEISVHFK